MTNEDLPPIRYITTSDHDLIGQEVFVRDSVDHGDEIYWQKGLLVKIERRRGDEYRTKAETKARYTALVDGRNSTFEWCAIASVLKPYVKEEVEV